MSTQLQESATVDSVKNVLLFVSDSLRDDALPDEIAELGIRSHAISPSTYTASSLPSIFTSTYPFEHRIWDFSYRLSEEPYLLKTAENGGVDVDAVWEQDVDNHEKPTLSILSVDHHVSYDDVEPPFTLVVHDHGGHAPYGDRSGGFSDNGEFFHAHRDDPGRIKDLYREGVDASAERFLNLYQRLERDSLLDDTLVIFTSDHGELLGEYGGIYEHTSPMVPETLKVPIVFCGAGLPNEEFSGLLSSIDLTPTMLGAQGREIPSEMNGADLWNGSQRKAPIRADIWRKTRFGDRIAYAASSVWDEGGGVVVHRGSRLGRAAFAMGTNARIAPYAPLVRRRPLRNLSQALRVYLPQRRDFGMYAGEYDPSSLLDDEFKRRDDNEEVDVDREQLEALGYVR